MTNKKLKISSTSSIDEGIISYADVSLAIEMLFKVCPDAHSFEDSLKVDMINSLLLKDTGVTITLLDYQKAQDCNTNDAILDFELVLKQHSDYRNEDYDMYNEM
jgi:hypothetical protein